MIMVRFWHVFLRVIRSYSIEEKVVSVILVVAFLVAGIQSAIEVVKTPGLLFGEGGSYTEGVLSERPVAISPLYIDFSDANRDISGLVFSGLTKYDPDLKSFVGDMADLTVTEDRKTYRFVMKDNLYWHDGTPLTAEDVYFTYHDIIQNPDFQNPILKANFEGVEIKLVDAKTIEFTLTRPNSFFLTNTNVGIVPKHILGEVPVVDLPFDTFNSKPVGSGPYMVESPVENLNDGRQRVVLNVNNTYYGERAKIKIIRFNIYPDADSMAKEKNTLNVIAKVPKDIWDEIDMANRFIFSNYELPQYTALFFNMDSEVLKKDKVRLALQKSVDKAELMKGLQSKTAVDTPLMELNQSDWIYKENLEEAKGALFDSGYKMPKDVAEKYRKDAKGNILKLTLLVRNYPEGTVLAKENTQVAEFFKSSWEKVGVETDVQYEEREAFEARMALHDYDMILTGQNLGYNYDTYSFWHSSQAVEGGLNLSNYRSFAADALIEKIRDTFDSKIKETLLKDLAKEISQDIPAIFLYRPSYTFASDGKVKGMVLKNLAFVSDRFSHMDRWCINCQ
jgi:peptide/nickel transport system substrate-binding protein